MNKFFQLLVIMMVVASVAFGQTYKISGKVTSSESGEPLVGANVFIKKLRTGAATDENGKFEFKVPKGYYFVTCSYIGYETVEEYVMVEDKDVTANFVLTDYEFSLSLTVLADRAKERETPVAFTNIDKSQMESTLGSQDIPLVLNTTPSVYSTIQGGGAGDARINVRGFDQRNVAIMINGIPVNDMENGWVYWSNWDGVGDATSSIQVQRGLSAVNLATPSIGGTMNIITDPSAQKAGFSFKREMGSGNFVKSTFFAHTGLIDNKFALSVGGVRKTGDGLVDKSWTDAYAYYVGAAYNINKNHRLEAYVMAAPQRHGQNLYKQNAAAYDHDYAKNVLGYSDADIAQVPEMGRASNPNWNVVDNSYSGKQYYYGEYHDRYSPNFLNERENYYNKPLANLNWYAKFSKNFSLYTTLYYSGGEGGGTGTYGSVRYNYHAGNRYASSLQRYVAWDETIATNLANVDTTNGKSVSKGIIRNSTNNQWTIGAISKAYYKFSDELSTSFGVDWRTAQIDHFREVRDLLGGAYFVETANDFDTTPTSKQKGLGDKVDYYNTNTIDWLGLYAQAEYTADKLSAYGMAGWSTISYSFKDHFRNANGKPFEIDADAISGYQFKGGVNYRALNDLDVYFNAGYVAKAPIFDRVINDKVGELVENPETENFLSFELGMNGYACDGKLNAKVNAYYTMWDNRTLVDSEYDVEVDEVNGVDETGIFIMRDLNQNHMGIEVEVGYQPVRFLRIDAMASFNNWTYTNEDAVKAMWYSYDSAIQNNYNIYLTDVKVGDAPQSQFALSATVFPFRGFSATLIYKQYQGHYAAFDPISRVASSKATADLDQSWKLPVARIFDLHANYQLPVDLNGLELSVFAHVFNLFDAIYVQDAVDNSAYNAISGYSHAAQSAEVYLGVPRYFNLGVSIAY